MKRTTLVGWPTTLLLLSTFGLTAGGATGCSPQDAPHAVVGQTGSTLSVDFIGGTDVIGFRMFVERVACQPEDVFEPFTAHADIDLLDGLMPGMVEVLEQRLDPTSRHIGADLFMALPVGCYDIVAAPAVAFDGDDFTPSADCAAAHTRRVEVMPGQTTEPPPMISQCVGALGGNIDIPVVLNHPPSITVEIDEKFAYECEPVQICATVLDVDDDPVEVTFDVLAEGDVLHAVEVGDLELVGFDQGARIWRQCATVVLRVTDTYSVEVTAYDLALRDGQPVRFERLLADAHGDEPGPPPSSRAHQVVPVHINWVEEPLCFNGDGELVPALGVEITRAEGCEYIDTETYYCQMGRDDIREHVCPDGELDENALYRPCPGCQAATEDSCDGLDDDCDGRIDEGVQNACGACGVVPEEACNGVDDDCDGPTDEGVLNACGACGDVPEEVCNGVDDDCDGVNDEGVLNACGACGDVPEEVCNGADDDCDGTTDEGVVNACGGCGSVPVERRNGHDDDCDGDVDEDTCEFIDINFRDHGFGNCNGYDGRDNVGRCMDENGGDGRRHCGDDELRAWCHRRIDQSWDNWLLERARERYPECRNWWLLEQPGPDNDWWICDRFDDHICPESNLRYFTPLMLLFGENMFTGPDYIAASSDASPLDLSSAQDGTGVTESWARGHWLLMRPVPGEDVTGRNLLGNATADVDGKARFSNGFEALAARYDLDGDGWVVSAEMQGSAKHGLPELVSWRDDGDRKAEEHELASLVELGVVAIRSVPRDDKVRFISRGEADGFARGATEAYVVRGDSIEPALVVDVYLR